MARPAFPHLGCPNTPSSHSHTKYKRYMCVYAVEQTVDRCFRLSAEAELLVQLIRGIAGCFVACLSANWMQRQHVACVESVLVRRVCVCVCLENSGSTFNIIYLLLAVTRRHRVSIWRVVLQRLLCVSHERHQRRSGALESEWRPADRTVWTGNRYTQALSVYNWRHDWIRLLVRRVPLGSANQGLGECLHLPARDARRSRGSLSARGCLRWQAHLCAGRRHLELCVRSATHPGLQSGCQHLGLLWHAARSTKHSPESEW